jgi:hypothetical protein
MIQVNGTTREARVDDSIGELLKGIRDDGIELLRLELQLFRAEASRSAKRMLRNGLYLAAGCVLGVFAAQVLVLTLCAAAFAMFAQWMTPEIAVILGPLGVGIVFLVAGVFLCLHGLRRLKQTNLKPHHTLESMEETRLWLAGEHQ